MYFSLTALLVFMKDMKEAEHKKQDNSHFEENKNTILWIIHTSLALNCKIFCRGHLTSPTNGSIKKIGGYLFVSYENISALLLSHIQFITVSGIFLIHSAAQDH